SPTTKRRWLPPSRRNVRNPGIDGQGFRGGWVCPEFERHCALCEPGVQRMKWIQLASNEYLLVFTDPDPEDVIAAINAFAAEHDIASGRLQAVGSVQSAMLAWWNNETNQVEKYPADGQFEV